jgi:hypothetical protein
MQVLRRLVRTVLTIVALCSVVYTLLSLPIGNSAPGGSGDEFARGQLGVQSIKSVSPGQHHGQKGEVIRLDSDYVFFRVRTSDDNRPVLKVGDRVRIRARLPKFEPDADTHRDGDICFTEAGEIEVLATLPEKPGSGQSK